MTLLVIGDVHGCYHSYNQLISTYWDYTSEILIQLGDLVDRGNFSPQCVNLSQELQNKFPGKAIFLKGNHEAEIISHFESGTNENWLYQCGKKTISQYKSLQSDLKEDAEWFRALPLYWENDHIFISHAGISITAKKPFYEDTSDSILWNRGKLKNIGKLQVFGHTPCKEKRPTYCKESNSWNIDTGSGYYGGYLSALRLSHKGSVMEIIRIKNLVDEIEETRR